MKRLFATHALLATALAVGVSYRCQAADELPKAETILDKAITVTGGKAAYQKIHTEISTGSMTINGMSGSATTWKAEPNKVYTEIVFQGLGTMQEGANGKVAWSNSAMQGPHVKEGDEKDTAMLMARFDAEVNWRDIFTKTETAGMEPVDGKDCYKLILTPKAGKPMTQFYEKESGLLHKSVMTVTSAMGEVTVETSLGDYRKEGEILRPHKLTNTAMGQQFVISIDKIEYNADIPASRFDLPAPIQALLDKDKEKK
jgi:outer membrane lipoprotein-sorting protein